MVSYVYALFLSFVETHSVEIFIFGLIWVIARAILIMKLKYHHVLSYSALNSPKIFGSIFTRSWWHLDKFAFLRQDKRLDDGLLSFIVIIFIPILVCGYFLWMGLLIITFVEVINIA